ncbi:AurF N-oxygenase family protein [Actinacidiphila sp. ITFR-21]|uniref:AurF N-oxygenase family protein n=1 Tax=Actinacidiphila sp. ITFR-21 TaxID=3075199 RepID=UPI00288C4FB4|nr:diiron oxygenase [Streptomyces sp. ITFR-21]WNI17991.1 diiron oxygenase [Streptomyces sp. ITFR-21]
MTTATERRRDADPLARQTKKASQLLIASAKHSYDPRVDINWDEPLEEGKWFLPEKRISIYGTDMYEALTLEQKLRLSREEMGSSLAAGVWTEHILMHLVSRYAYKRDVTSPQVQFALTEVADEVRHMIMFARLAEKLDIDFYPVSPKTQRNGLLLKTFAPVPALWAMILLTEEFFDRFQREQANDETVQPVIRAVARIHVVEEARHISFARTELERFVPTLSKRRLEMLRNFLANVVKTIRHDRYNPLMYERAGLDPKAAIAAGRNNPIAKANGAYGAERLAPYYQSIGLIGGKSEKIWREAGWLKDKEA